MRKRVLKRLAIPLALSFCPFAAFAQGLPEEDLALAYGDQGTVSVATGSQVSLRRAPSVAAVVTAEDMAAMGATQLTQVLESVPGIHINYSTYGAPVINMRGIGGAGPTSPQVLVLMDGVPLVDEYRGDPGYLLARIPLENVSRIEIIRGPGSALYGADALAGVINIITKGTGDSSGGEAGMRYGTDNTFAGWGRYAGHAGPLALSGFVEGAGSDGAGQKVPADQATYLDRVFHNQSSLAPGLTHNDYQMRNAVLDAGYGDFHWRGSYYEVPSSGVDAGVSSALDPLGGEKLQRTASDMSWSNPQVLSDLGLGVQASYVYFSDQSHFVLFPPGAKIGPYTFSSGVVGEPERDQWQLRLSASGTYSGLIGHNLRFGAGYDDIDLFHEETHKNYLLSPAGAFIPSGVVLGVPGAPTLDFSTIQPHIRTADRRDSYGYVQDAWSFAPDWALTAGVRYDSYSDFGGTANPRVALVWDVSLDVTAKLLYGTAFRAPSFNEEYGVNPVANGNPDLRPETIRTTEAAISWQAARSLTVDMNAFHYGYDQIIAAVANPAPTPGATYQNTGGMAGNGFETQLVWDAAANLRLIVDYSFQHAMLNDNGSDPSYDPRHHLFGRADWRFLGGWQSSVQINYVADRHRAFNDPRPGAGDYATVDLAVHGSLGIPGWEISGMVRNLFNAPAAAPSLAPGTALPDDIPTDPRLLLVQTSVRF
jgi:iron complex outermembrane receptor protein